MNPNSSARDVEPSLADGGDDEDPTEIAVGGGTMGAFLFELVDEGLSVGGLLAALDRLNVEAVLCEGPDHFGNVVCKLDEDDDLGGTLDADERSVIGKRCSNRLGWRRELGPPSRGCRSKCLAAAMIKVANLCFGW